MLVSIKYLLVSCHHLRLLLHQISLNDDTNCKGMFTADKSSSQEVLSQSCCASKAAEIRIDWFIRNKHKNRSDIWSINLVDANFLSKTVFILKHNYQVRGIHEITCCIAIGLFPITTLSPALYQFCSKYHFHDVATAPSHYCGCKLQQLDDKSLSQR